MEDCGPKYAAHIMCTRRLALAVAAHHLLASDGFAVPSCRVAPSGVARRNGISRTYTDLQMLVVERYPDPLEEERGKKREEQAIADRDSGDGITIIEHTDVTGPTASLAPDEVVPILMNALQNNDVPTKDAGLRLVGICHGDHPVRFRQQQDRILRILPRHRGRVPHLLLRRGPARAILGS